MFRERLTLQKHAAENMFPGIPMQIVDPVILSGEGACACNFQSGRNAMQGINNAMLCITKLAQSCSKQAPTERMRIAATHVVAQPTSREGDSEGDEGRGRR
jgi:hypothetical protein